MRAATPAVLIVGTLAVGAPSLAAQQDTLRAAPAAASLPPAGFGTLRQDDVAVRLETATLQIRLLPLHEGVIRLLAQDTYASLHRLRETRDSDIARVGRRYGLSEPTVFIVTFFGRQDRARFEPELLTITSQNRFFRPVEILPLSPLWNRRQLNQRETATALYIYQDGIRILDPFEVKYEGVASTDWERSLRTLDRERALVLARAARKR
ncbi:MAG: hypothetical protein ACE5PT_15320 [Gemmatimonadales bacterium]